MTTTILIVLVSVLVTLGYVFSYSRVIHWRGSYEAVDEACQDLSERLVLAVEEKTKADNDLKVFKDYLGLIAGRQIVAQLTQEQLDYIVHNITAMLTPKEKQN